MYRYLLTDKDFKELNIPLPAPQYRELEENAKRNIALEPITIWREYILTGYEQYDICIKYHRQYSCTEKSFSRKANAIVWLCQNQLKRKELSRPAICWLFYRLYEALLDNEKYKEAKEQFQYRQLSPYCRHEKTSRIQANLSSVLKQISDAYGLHKLTIRNYVKFGRQLDALDKMFPGVRVRVLKGELEIAIMYMDALMQMPVEELSRMISDPNCKKLLPPESITREILQKRDPRLRKKAHVTTAIKEIPTYDPDAELKGLTYTVSAWTRALTRTAENADLSHATKSGKEYLLQTINQLRIECDKFCHALEERNHE